MSEDIKKQKIMQIRSEIGEKAILGKVAELLEREKLINPDEKMRFLSFLKEDLLCH